MPEINISESHDACRDECCYQNVIEAFSEEEIEKIVQLKRLFEWVGGDPVFADSFCKGEFTDDQLDRLRKIGITFEMKDMAPFWEYPDFQFKMLQQISCLDEEMSDELANIITKDSLPHLWLRYAKRKNRIFRTSRKYFGSVPKNPKFDAWRFRRIAATRNELGFFGHQIDHPILAFELGDGCSVGCWFCAFATRKLNKNFDYNENRGFFRKVAEACVDIFGPDQAGMTLLYYGTEPHDNPNYLDFLKEFKDVTGHVTCTSTAVPGDEEWIRSLIGFYRQQGHPWPRLSVLTRPMMFKIHEAYTPDELRDVELLMQMKDHSRKKVSGGRILEEYSGMKNRDEGHYLDEIVPQGSIACVSGFLINMVNRTIEIVSPCYTSAKWPKGYRVFDSAAFKDADDFGRVMDELIDRNMPLSPDRKKIASFRDDLVFRLTDEGFDLLSPNQIHHFSGKEIYWPLGRMIADGNMKYEDIYEAMIEKDRINPVLINAAVSKLYDGGFLNEVRDS